MMLVCGGCSRAWSPRAGECAHCGSTFPINPQRTASVAAIGPAGVQITTLDRVAPLRPIRFPALLSEFLDGIVPGLSILLWGLPGAGKSTLAAQLGAAMAAKMRGVLYWCDREQLDPGLLRACFDRTRSPVDRLRVISPRGGESETTWRAALSAVGHDAAAVVLDSLQTWAPRMTEQKKLLQACRDMRRTVIVISHATKDGDAAGRLMNQHAADACVMVAPEALTVTKCRWCPAPRTMPRSA